VPIKVGKRQIGGIKPLRLGRRGRAVPKGWLDNVAEQLR
jgi:hypothetical protein